MNVSAPPLTVTSMRLADARLHNLPAATASSVLGASMAITLMRAPIGAVGVLAVTQGLPGLAFACFVAFATIDLVDGLVARRRGEETGLRRIVDVVVDRITIHAALLAIVSSLPGGMLMWTALAVRDVAQGALSGNFTRRHMTVLVGPKWHMCYGLSVLAFVGSALFLPAASPALLIVLWLLSALTFVDFARRVAALTRMSSDRP